MKRLQGLMAHAGVGVVLGHRQQRATHIVIVAETASSCAHSMIVFWGEFLLNIVALCHDVSSHCRPRVARPRP